MLTQDPSSQNDLGPAPKQAPETAHHAPSADAGNPPGAFSVTSARLVPLGRYGIETKAVARSWDIEITFSTGDRERMKAGFKVRSLAITTLGKLLAEFRALGLDGRTPLRASCSPARRHLSLVPGGPK